MQQNFSSAPPPSARPSPGHRAWLAAAVGGVALLAAGSAARAATINVQYSTFGTFAVGSSTGTSVAGPSTNPNANTTISSSGGSIRFRGNSYTESVTPPAPESADFGVFTTAGDVSAFNGATFTLDLNQTSPAAGSGSSTANLVTATIFTTTFGATFNFTPNPIVVSSGGTTVSYQLNDPQTLRNDNTTTLAGNITAVPSPAAAGAGLAMLGGVLVSRRRSVAV